MNPEKTSVQANSQFVRAVLAAGDGGWNFSTYLADAALTLKQSRKWQRKRDPVVPPGRGFSPSLRQAIADQFPQLQGEEPIDVRWAVLDGDDFFHVDHAAHVITLNKRYRWALTAETGASLNDAPLIKAFMYLLLEPLFRDSHFGPKDKDNLSLWQEILTAAAVSQEKQST